jgi:AcrR family transcriptional regulator
VLIFIHECIIIKKQTPNNGQKSDICYLILIFALYVTFGGCMEEYLEKKDRRIGKTQKNIRDAFINLITEKEISQITVKELAEKADINRKTFYMHYSSIEDVLDKIENEIIEKLLSVLEQYDFFDSQFDIYALFCSLNDVINEDFDLYKRLVYSSSYNFLIIKVKELLKDALLNKYNKKLNMNKELYSLYAEYTASGVISLYIEWFKTNSELSLEDLAKVAGNITFNGVSVILAK